ncbi:hypothetical protein V5E38_01295 [Rossellomorea sp. GAMAL-10_SWC]
MLYVAIITNLMCGLIILLTGIVYMKNTLKTSNVNQETITYKKVFSEFKLGDFYKLLFISFMFGFLLSVINQADIGSDLIFNIVLSSFTVVISIESICYLLKRPTLLFFYKTLVSVILLFLLSGSYLN